MHCGHLRCALSGSLSCSGVNLIEIFRTLVRSIFGIGQTPCWLDKAICVDLNCHILDIIHFNDEVISNQGVYKYRSFGAMPALDHFIESKQSRYGNVFPWISIIIQYKPIGTSLLFNANGQIVPLARFRALLLFLTTDNIQFCHCVWVTSPDSMP